MAAPPRFNPGPRFTPPTTNPPPARRPGSIQPSGPPRVPPSGVRPLSTPAPDPPATNGGGPPPPLPRDTGPPAPAPRDPPARPSTGPPPPLPRDTGPPAPVPRDPPARSSTGPPPPLPRDGGPPTPVPRDEEPLPSPTSTGPPSVAPRDRVPTNIAPPVVDRPARLPISRENSSTLDKPPTIARIPPPNPMAMRVPPSGNSNPLFSPVASDPSDPSRELAALRAKLAQYEAELKRSNDTILVQEEEIRKLTEQSSAGTDSSDFTASPRTSVGDQDDYYNSKKKKSSTHKSHHSKDKDKKKKHSRTSTSNSASPAVAPPTARKSDYKSSGTITARQSTNSSSAPIVASGLKHSELRKGPQRDSFSDLTITTSGPAGSSSFHVHACMISARSPVLDKILQDRYDSKNNKKKMPKKKAIELKNASDPTTFSKILDYLYSDDETGVLSSKTGPAEILAITHAARRYGVERLVWLCENYFASSLTLQTVIPLLKASSSPDSDLKDERVKAYCLSFLLQPANFASFVVRKDLTNELGMDLFTEVVTLNAGVATGKSVEQPRLGSQPPSTYFQDMKGCYDSMNYADGSVTIDAEVVYFHKAILVAASEKIYTAFSKAKFTAGNLDDASETMLLTKDHKFHNKLSAEAFKSMLRYIYYGDTDIDPLSACMLIPVVRFYGLYELQEICERRMKDAVNDSRVVVRILGTTYLAINASREEMRDKLRADCIAQIVKNIREIEVDQLKSMDKEYALDAAMEIIHGMQQNAKGRM